MPQTQFFHSCLGIFQGGGCRAAALVGAYTVAIKRGVKFIELAGTSAGSIVAVFVAAGATPQQLEQFINELDFKKLLSPPQSTRYGFFGWGLKYIWRDYTNLWCNQGFYSSEGIEIWVEKCLRVLIGPHQGPIPFHKLKTPVSVVATDILTRRVRIWSQTSTPDESVAKAVRTSCSIPIFFQPVDQRYVDGGVLSNLPAFIFSSPFRAGRLNSRVLAFTLKGNDEILNNWGTKPFLSAVANTVVDGAQDIQTTIQRGIHTIIIPTGDIKATDFDKINQETLSQLINAGTKAAADFFDTEITQVKAPRITENICLTQEDIYNHLVNHLNEEIHNLVVCEYSTKFVYSIFPTLYLFASRGVRINVVLPPLDTHSQDTKNESYRRQLLRHLGATVIESGSPPFKGYLVNCDHAPQGKAYIAPDVNFDAGFAAMIYDGTIHSAAVEALYQKAISSFGSNTPTPVFKPKMVATEQNKLITRLKTLPEYSKRQVSLRIESVSIKNLVALTTYVHEYKYRQMQLWLNEYNKKNIPLFDPTAITLLNDQLSLVTPPVVENSGGTSYVLIEGSTRATYLRDLGEEQIICIVARGITDPLPSSTFPFADVKVAGRGLTTEGRYNDFNYSLFRHIERAVRPLDSLQ